MFGNYSFASVAPCRYGPADDEPPMSPKQMFAVGDGQARFDHISTHTKPSPVKAPQIGSMPQPASTTHPDTILPSVESPDGHDMDSGDHEQRVAAALMDIRRRRRQQHTRFQSDPKNVSRIHQLASGKAPARQPTLAPTVILEPPPLIPKGVSDATKDSSTEDRPISPDPDENHDAMRDDEGFSEGDPFEDATWSQTTLALWKIRARTSLKRRGYYELGDGSPTLLKCPRVVKSRPRMRRRRPEQVQPPPTDPQPSTDAATSTQ